jgi:uncharacterized protein (TIGR03083 family)
LAWGEVRGEPSGVSALRSDVGAYDDALLDLWMTGLRASGERLLAVDPAQLDRPVAACPGWDVAELLRHVGGLHWWFAVRVRDAPGREHKRGSFPQPPDNAEGLLAWGHEQLALALRELDARRADGSLDTIVSTWAGDQPAAWVVRRLCHETLVHAWDGEAAAGATTPMEPAIAAEAIDEALELFHVGLFTAESFGSTGETLHLHCTDTDGEWLVTLGPDNLTLSREHAKGDVAVRGRAEDLLLAIWNRVPPGEAALAAAGLELFGDTALFDRYRATTAI